jgi:Icc-related predicted phosphoesterase
MEFTVISDTHGQHRSLHPGKGDVIIHAGDVSMRGRETEVKDFLDWFSALPFTYKIFIAGNHDFYFERTARDDIRRIIPPGVTYLNDESARIEGLHIWGSPITPWFYDWAFNRHRGEAIRRHWQLIPEDADVVVTHGPVHGIHDRTVRGEQVGCEDLSETIKTLRPRVHICGHIHEGYGKFETDHTLYLNSSVLNERYDLVNAPHHFTL